MKKPPVRAVVCDINYAKSQHRCADSARCTKSERRLLSRGAEPSAIVVISNSPVIAVKASSFSDITNDIPGTPEETKVKS